MVNKIHYRWDFVGLSTDTKPTPEESPKVVNGSTYYESDTSKLFVFYKDTWYERKPLGGGEGSSYTAGDGIDITNNTISVDTDAIQPKLTAGTNITIDANNVISAGAGGSDGARTLRQSDYNWPVNNPDGVAIWKMPVGFYRASDDEPVKVYITNTFSYTANASNFSVLVGDKGDFGNVIFRLHATSESTYGYTPAEFYVLGTNGTVTFRMALYGVYNTLTSSSKFNPLSANQGRVLKDLIDALDARVTALEGN